MRLKAATRILLSCEVVHYVILHKPRRGNRENGKEGIQIINSDTGSAGSVFDRGF